MNIQININDVWQDASQKELLELVQTGVVQQNTDILLDGKQTRIKIIEGLIFPCEPEEDLYLLPEGVPPNNSGTTQSDESLGSSTSEQGQTFNLEAFFKVVSNIAAIFIKVIGVLVATLVIVTLFLATKIKNLPWQRFIAKGKAMIPKLWQYRKSIAIGLCVFLLIFNLWGYGKRNTEEVAEDTTATPLPPESFVTKNTTTTQTPSPSQLQLPEEEKGKTVEVNKDTPVSVLQSLAEQENAKAQFFLGVCYYFGGDVSQNYVKAVEWLTKAAEQGNADAQYFWV